MTQTTNYQLPQWVASDPIQRADFNAAFAKIDTAMKQNADAVVVARAANCLVRLGQNAPTTADNQTITFDLSGIDLSGYAALFFTLSAYATSGAVYLNANGTQICSVCSNNRSTSTGIVWMVPSAAGKIVVKSTMVVDETGIGSGNSAYATTNWTAVTTLTLSGTSGAGMVAALYGLKK